MSCRPQVLLYVSSYAYISVLILRLLRDGAGIWGLETRQGHTQAGRCCQHSAGCNHPQLRSFFLTFFVSCSLIKSEISVTREAADERRMNDESSAACRGTRISR